MWPAETLTREDVAMKVRIGKRVHAARLYFSNTHGIALIQFGPVLIEPTYLARQGATVVAATPAERAVLRKQHCPIDVLPPERPESDEWCGEDLESPDLLCEG